MLQGILKMGVDEPQLNSLSERIDLLYPSVARESGQPLEEQIENWWLSDLIREF